MIASALAALVVALGPDPCAPVKPEGAPDPAAAAEYRAVGDAERKAGLRDTAAAAYRGALAHDPGDGRARASLAELCREELGASAYERGVRLMESGDRRGAIAAFEEARADRADSAAALLEGICLYDEGEDARAGPLLAEAEQDPRHRDAARFFLGLVALRAGRGGEAATLLEASAVDRHLGPLALGLARDARRDGRLVLSLLAEGGWDSNADLTPDGSRALASSRDGAWGATAAARLSPLGASGPFVSAAATLKNQLQYSALDLRGVAAAAGWQAGQGGRYALAEYGYEYRDLGGGPYLSAQRLLGSVRLALGRGASAGATYLARWESYLASTDTAYSGLRHVGEADLTLDVAPRSTATLAWRVGRDAARDAALSFWEQGPRAALRWQLARDVRLGVDASYAWRLHDAVDAVLGVQRYDRLAEAAALVETELAARWTLRVSVTARKVSSNVPEFTYTQVVPMIGLAYTVGLL